MDNATLNLDWGDYEIYAPGIAAPLDEVSRAIARGAFRRLMQAKTHRISELHKLLAVNSIELDTSDASIQAMNDWFFAHVEADPGHPGRLLPDWYSVVNDIGLFLGDVMIERHPGLHWEFFTWGKKNVSYQRHVIMGFSKVPNAKFNVDPDMSVASYAHEIIASRGSIATYGTVEVRGTMIDVDAAAARARARARPIERDMFVGLLREVAELA